ncbi:Rap1a/Tai family immunity protein [Lichenicoccus sp.]|uniref:Rap1a/Tai family immunity protein n=1 Tax=Lichenicoccus sp. TaxID=2781899 RepID=UPI003D0E6594
MRSKLPSLLLTSAFAVACLSPASQAQRVSMMPAGKFLQICSSPHGVPACDAYLAGMADSFALIQSVAEKSSGEVKLKPQICIPKTIATADMRGSVVSWLKSHQERLHSQVGESVYEALHTAYPCNGG